MPMIVIKQWYMWNKTKIVSDVKDKTVFFFSIPRLTFVPWITPCHYFIWFFSSNCNMISTGVKWSCCLTWRQPHHPRRAREGMVLTGALEPVPSLDSFDRLGSCRCSWSWGSRRASRADDTKSRTAARASAASQLRATGHAGSACNNTRPHI